MGASCGCSLSPSIFLFLSLFIFPHPFSLHLSFSFLFLSFLILSSPCFFLLFSSFLILSLLHLSFPFSSIFTPCNFLHFPSCFSLLHLSFTPEDKGERRAQQVTVKSLPSAPLPRSPFAFPPTTPPFSLPIRPPSPITSGPLPITRCTVTQEIINIPLLYFSSMQVMGGEGDDKWGRLV